MLENYSLLYWLSFFGLTLVIVYVIWLWHMWRYRHFIRDFPSLDYPIFPIIGQAYILFGNSEELVKTLLENVKETPTFFWLGPLPQLLIAKPEDMATVLSSPDAINRIQIMRKVFGGHLEGLMMENAPKWYMIRKVVTAAFTTTNVQNLIPDINVESASLLQQFDRFQFRRSFQVNKCISFGTFCFASRVFMGIDFNSTICKTDRLSCFESANTCIDIARQRIFSFWLHPEILFRLSPLYKRLKKHVKYLEYAMDQFLYTKIHNNKLNCIESREKYDFTNCLLEAAKKYPTFTLRDLRNQLKTVMFTGFESTALAASFVLMALAYHRDIQAKLYMELEKFIPDPEQDVDKVTLNHLTYLDKVMRETLRIFTPVPMSGRQTTASVKLADGRTIPAGMNIILLYHLTHRDEKHWPNANVFDPERFSEQINAQRHPFAFVAFGGGRRNCIGGKLAMIHVKIVVAKIIRKFHLSTTMSWADITDFKYGLTLQIQKPIEVYLTPRL